MTKRVDEFRFQVSDSIDLWQANVANPYIRAYNAAYKSYNQTFETQKSNDKERAELLVSAAAILPGSFLIATAATGSLRVLAHRAMLKMLATNNLTRVLGGYNAATNNATLKFAFGGLLDLAKGQMNDGIKKIAVNAATMSQNTLTDDPLDRDKHLDSFFKNHKVALTDAASLIEQSSILEAEKVRQFAALKAAPLASRPQGKIDKDALAPKIELGLYMMALLESDFLEVTPAHAPNSYGASPRPVRTPINVMPKDTQHYPKATMPKVGIGVIGQSQSISIDRPGGDVENRIDELCKIVLKRPFYAKAGWFGKDPTLKAGELRQAQDVLEMLSKHLSPMVALGLKS